MRAHLIVCIAILAAHTAATAAPPKVAVVYSSWGNYAFRDEFDGHLKSLGWPCETFENKDIAKWIGRLGEFDIVIAASVANYENPQDMAQYKDAWLGFLNRGGALLITDASYGTALDLWTNKLWPDAPLTTAGCAPHTKLNGGSNEITCDAASPLLRVPHELPGLLRDKDGIWAHIESWGAAWKSLVTCADGKSLYVYRDVGKGCVVVTSYFSFRGNGDAATGLLDNLWTHTQGLRSGVAITAFDVGEAMPGARTVRLGLHNATGGEASYDITLKVSAEAQPTEIIAKPHVLVGASADAEVTFECPIRQRGEVNVVAEVSEAQRPVARIERRLSIPPMVALKIRNPHLYPVNRELPFSAAFAPDAGVALSDCEAELLINEKPVLHIRPIKASGFYVADIASLQPGEYAARLELRKGDVALGAAKSGFFVHRQARVYSRPDGTTIVDGKPFFPFGWYHVSWGFTAEQRLAFLRNVAAGGFNTVHASIKQADEWDAFLDEADKRGVHVVTEFRVDPLLVIKRYRDKPAVLAWNPGDEPDGGGVAPEEMFRRYDEFKKADPNHPTYMTLCVPQRYAKYAGCAEIIAPDPYPINRTDPTPGTVYEMLSQARTEAAKYGRPVWGVLQCFGYKDGGWRVPTFAECRNMTYLALLAGVKGIIYYTYADQGFRIPDNPDLWAQMKTLPAEMKTLEPALLDGHLVKLETGLADVMAGAWTVDNRVIVCVVNASEKESRQVTVTLPLAAKGEARALFAGRPAGMMAEGGKLAGTIEPLAVHVYEFTGR